MKRLVILFFVVFILVVTACDDYAYPIETKRPANAPNMAKCEAVEAGIDSLDDVCHNFDILVACGIDPQISESNCEPDGSYYLTVEKVADDLGYPRNWVSEIEVEGQTCYTGESHDGGLFDFKNIFPLDIVTVEVDGEEIEVMPNENIFGVSKFQFCIGEK